ncbi:MAG TPA: DUF445 domain-containing protein [Bacteroidota bacterium]
MESRRRLGRNRIGHLSLACTAGGMILVEAGIRAGLLGGPFWQVLLTGFEAGTVGGLADWFAVTALFHEVPLPYIRRHTNIIIRNRERLTEGAVDLVANKWLSPDAVRDKLAGLSVSTFILEWMHQEGNRGKILRAARDVFARVADGFDSPAAAGFLERMMREQVREADLAGPLGRWLGGAFRRGDHSRLWTALFNASRRAVNDPQSKRQIRRLVHRAIDEYSDKSLWRTLGVTVGEVVGLIDAGDITETIVQRLNDFIDQSASDPGHPLRARLEEAVLGFAGKLAAGDPEAAAAVNGIRERLLNNPEARTAVTALLARFKAALHEQLASTDTALMRMLDEQLTRALHEIEQSPETREQLDRWFRENLLALADQYHHTIAEIVRTSLHPARLDDRGLVDQIEEKVGNDLQYIRLNGAVVGGAAGIALAILRLLL